jgi:hypothetical protein
MEEVRRLADEHRRLALGKYISDQFYRLSTGWVTLAALVFFVAFTALVLPRQSAQAEAGAGGAGSPDMSFWYSPRDLYRMAEAYGEQGRAAYVRARYTFDVVWPLVYTAFLTTGISWIYARAFTAGSRWRRANLLPALGALLDYLENLATSAVMVRYPIQTPVVDVLAPVFTAGKWVLIGGSFLALVAGVVAGVWRWAKKRV